MSETREPQADATPRVAHCPVCGRTYTDEARYLCSIHPTLLVAGPPPAEGDTATPPRAANRRRLRLPGVVVIASAVLGVLLGYVVHQNRSAWLGHLRTGAQAGREGEYPLKATAASVVRGDLKGRDITLPVPDYPEEAFRQKLTGSVTVQVIAGRDGRVTDARALSGPAALRAAAEQAARGARFAAGSSARRVSVIRYDFTLCRENGECAD